MRCILYSALWLGLSGPGKADTEAAYEAVKAEVGAAIAEGDYDRAVAIAAEAYAETGDVRHLFAQAQAERQRGNCEAGKELYAQVLATPLPKDPSYETLHELARDGFRICEEELALVPPPEPTPEPPAPTPTPTPVAPAPPKDTPPPRHRHWFADPAGVTLFATGIAGIAVGGVLHGRSSSVAANASEAPDEAGYAAELTQARRLLVGAVVSYSIAGALLLGATVRWAVVARRGRREVSRLPGGLRIRF